MRTDTGALFVRVDGRLHPVENLASARLIAGAPEEPASISAAALSQEHLGAALGIPLAPGVFAAEPVAQLHWLACVAHSGAVTVAAQESAIPLSADEAVLARTEAGTQPTTWMLTSKGRIALPEGDTHEGRTVGRRLGIDSTTPTWRVPSDVIAAAPELAPVAAPDPLPEVRLSDGEYWARSEEGASTLTELQTQVLMDLGAEHRNLSGGERAELAGAPVAEPVQLPDRAPNFVDLHGEQLCTAGPGQAIFRLPESGAETGPELDDAHLESAAAGKVGAESRGAGVGPRGAVPVPAGGLADFFLGPRAGAISVDTGMGVQVVTDNGIRHRVPDEGAAAALGLPEPTGGWWPALRLLPEGPPLDAATARQVVVPSARP